MIILKSFLLKVNNLDKSGVVNESFRQIMIDSIMLVMTFFKLHINKKIILVFSWCYKI